MKKTESQSINENEPEPTGAAEPLVAVHPTPMSPEEIEDLKEKAAKADENWDRLLRTTADFDNFKKRATREKREAVEFANESLLTKLIPVLDNFDMALAAAQNGGPDTTASLQTGITMIHQLLKSTLAEAGLEEVDASGQAFDPNLHEAVAQKDASDAEDGQVVQQLRKGYRLRGRLLRPASVVVGRKPAA
jgi:molecular chaperone GrpE